MARFTLKALATLVLATSVIALGDDFGVPGVPDIQAPANGQTSFQTQWQTTYQAKASDVPKKDDKDEKGDKGDNEKPKTQEAKTTAEVKPATTAEAGEKTAAEPTAEKTAEPTIADVTKSAGVSLKDPGFVSIAGAFGLITLGMAFL